MRFATTLLRSGNNTGIEVPPALIDELGGGKRPAVTVSVNGFTYRSTVGVMGGRYLIPFSSDKRAATGLAGGDEITVELDLDTASREVEVPIDLAEALNDANVTDAFAALSPSAKKAHVTSVAGAKAAETRTRRIEAIVAKLSV